MVIIPVLVEWRFIMMVVGEQCVMGAGILLMLQWCVESWTVGRL